MANMSLGSTTFTLNPSRLPVIKEGRTTAKVDTHDGVAFFSWGSSIVGQEIELYWNYMIATDFDAIQALLEADEEVVFDPQAGDSKTYNVEILSLDGDNYITNTSGSGVRRKDVFLNLLIMSEVT